MRGYMPRSKSDIHETPDRVYDLIKGYWGYSKDVMFDPCPIDYKQNALQLVWQKVNYVNPPYSLLKEFVADAIHQADMYHHTTIMLLPSKTEQEWFHDLVKRDSVFLWIRKRLTFKNHKNNATQPHFLVMIQ